MSPYREAPLVQTKPVRKPQRHWLWRLHLWVKGPWRSRFIRCKECGEAVPRDKPGDFLGPELSHQIKHNSQRLRAHQEDERLNRAKEREYLALIAEAVRRRSARRTSDDPG